MSITPNEVAKYSRTTVHAPGFRWSRDTLPLTLLSMEMVGIIWQSFFSLNMSAFSFILFFYKIRVLSLGRGHSNTIIFFFHRNFSIMSLELPAHQTDVYYLYCKRQRHVVYIRCMHIEERSSKFE